MSQQTNNFTWPVILSLSLSGIALLLSGFTFFWDRLRRTKLTAFVPSRYFVVSNYLRIVLTFKADGPKPILIEDLQLNRYSGQSPLKFKFTLEELESARHKPKSSFVVAADKPEMLVCEFELPTEEEDRVSKTSKLVLQALLGNSKKWKNLCQFSLNNCEGIDQSPIQIFI
jgi:hypothetical protein